MQVMPTPLVTIVIPAYNHGNYLKQAIDSVLNQDYSNIELIVLDDGSTDNTREVLDGFGDRFYWECQKNMGQASTLNKGWGMAKGEILAYLSADDVLLPQATSKSVQCLQDNPDAVLCYGDFRLIDSESRLIRNVTAPEYSYREMVVRFICAPGPGAYFRRSAFVHTDGWDAAFRQYPDYDYWLRLGLLGSFVHIHEQLAVFRVHEDSQTFAQAPTERAEEALRVMEKYFQLPSIPAEIVSANSQAMANARFVVAQLHLRAGRYKAAFLQIRKAILISTGTFFSLRVQRMLANGFFNRWGHKVLRTIKNCLNYGN
jgi:glycosyltransferase involved in cell wall biosynthesis